MTKFVDYQPCVRPAPGTLDEVAELRLEVAELKSRLEQLTNSNPVPVSDVLSKYSALPSGHGTFSAPPVAVNAAEGVKRRAVGNALDSIQSLISQTVLTRNGTSTVVRREDAEGGMIVQLSLPGGGGILGPSQVNEVLGQITLVVRNEFPAARLDCLRAISIGQGSPVSASDSKHLVTLRVLVPLPPDIGPTNDLNRNLKAVMADD
jgi:hypothetical protein